MLRGELIEEKQGQGGEGDGAEGATTWGVLGEGSWERSKRGRALRRGRRSPAILCVYGWWAVSGRHSFPLISLS